MLVEDLFVRGEVRFCLSHHDRVLIGGAMPAGGTLELLPPAEIRAKALCDRRELGVVCLSGPGIVTADGKLHELDVLVCATGFDAVDGNYVRINIQGRSGQTLKEHWSEGPTSYLGMATNGFPNMFMILGPNGPFTNLPPSIETQVEWIADTVAAVSATESGWMDVRSETETDWTQMCLDIADQTLFPQVSSWIFGANIPGKKRTVMFYLGGIKEYRSLIAAERLDG